MSLKYRADIDGLRAIAVLTVIGFHADIPGFSGGFIGVDIFFVISGFLITSILLKEIHNDKFSITRFYGRRVRRIFPALFPVIAFTLIVGMFLLDYRAFKELGESITATTLFSSNILFWRQAGYFDTASIQKPLLHTWSLAVEEQFYIFFPLLLVAINRFGKKQYLKWLLGIGLISLFTSIYGIYSHPWLTFYLVPSRAWELLAGSIIALRVIPLLRTNVQRNIVSFIGFGLIFYSLCFYTKTTLFPGVNALAPVLGASLIIFSGMEGKESAITKLLSLKPLVYTGLISYSLYLWHWPLFAFAKYLFFRELTPLEISGIILSTFIISALSLKYIEQPFRNNHPIFSERKKLFAVSAILMLVTSLIGGLIYIENGLPYRYPETIAVVQQEKWDWLINSVYGNLDQPDEIGNPGRCGKSGNVPCFLLWGDSHAIALVPGLDKKAKEYGLSGYITTHSACPPLLGVEQSGLNFNGLKFNNNVLRFIKNHPEIHTIFLAAAWSAYDKPGNLWKEGILSQDPKINSALLFKKGLFKTVDSLLKMNRNVVFVSDIPYLKNYDSPRIFYLQLRFPEYYQSSKKIFQTTSEYNTMNNGIQHLFQEMEERINIRIIHPESVLFDISGHVIYLQNDIPLYLDASHLSTYGSYFVAPIFDNIFKNGRFISDKSNSVLLKK